MTNGLLLSKNLFLTFCPQFVFWGRNEVHYNMAVRPRQLWAHVRSCRLTATCFLTPDELETPDRQTEGLRDPSLNKTWTLWNSTVITQFWRSYSLQKRPELLSVALKSHPWPRLNMIRNRDTGPDWKAEKQRVFKTPETLQALTNMATTETQVSRTVFLLENQRLHRDWKLAGILCRLCCIFGPGPQTEWTPGDFAPGHPRSPVAKHSLRSRAPHRQNRIHLLKKPWSNTLKDSQHYLVTFAGLLYFL